MHRDHAIDSARPLNDEGRVSACATEKYVRLGLVPVRLVGPKESVVTYAFLDNGSDTTVVRSDLSHRLGLEENPKPLTINTLHGAKMVNSSEVDLTI